MTGCYTRPDKTVADTSNDAARAACEKMLAQMQAAGVTLFSTPDNGDDENENDRHND